MKNLFSILISSVETLTLYTETVNWIKVVHACTNWLYSQTTTRALIKTGFTLQFLTFDPTRNTVLL